MSLRSWRLTSTATPGPLERPPHMHLLATLLLLGTSRNFVRGGVLQESPSIVPLEGEGSILLGRTSGHDPIPPYSNPNFTSNALDDFAGTTSIPTRSVTAILPFSEESLGHLHEILGSFLRPVGVAQLQEVILVVPEALRGTLAHRLQTFQTLPKQVDQPEFTLRTAENDRDPHGPATLLGVADISTPWLLITNWHGLRGLDDIVQANLLRTGHRYLPVGTRGTPLANHSQAQSSSLNAPGFASHLAPPFVTSRLSLPAPDENVRTWEALGQLYSQCNSVGAGGLLLPFPVKKQEDMPRSPSTTISEAQPSIIPARQGRNIRFTFLLAHRLYVQKLSLLACRLLSEQHTVTILIIETNPRLSFSSVKRKSRLINGPCQLDFLALNHFMRRRELISQVGSIATDVIVTLSNLQLNQHFLQYFVKEGNVLVSLPEKDLAYCDWMSTLSILEWKNWNKPSLGISVITRDRPSSLGRLLKSMSQAHYFGDRVDLRLNVEQDCDYETLNIARNYRWAHGSVFVHHRIVHAGLLPAIVESWYPQSNDSYGLLLEDDVELSPLFYAWAKMAILKYRYGKAVDKRPNLFGISLYQQKQVELRQAGRVPFDARRVFSIQEAIHPATPYLSQVPCSWGAVYFPEHWQDFHEYLSHRFAETWISIDEAVVPDVRSNNWLRSWKKFFIEMAYLKGYVMLYPNFDDFASLSTNHLEIGSHVKDRSKEKQELFDLPLMPVPQLGELTSLAQLPNGGLPRFRDMPILNLTAAITTLEEVEAVGHTRFAQLCAKATVASEKRSNRHSFCTAHLEAQV